MLKVPVTQDSEVKELIRGASTVSKPGPFFSNYLFDFGCKPIQDYFQHDFTRVTDEADGSVVLTQPF